MYSYGPPHMAEQKQEDQLEHTYSSYVRIRDVALKTCQRRWTIGKSGERGSGVSVLAARHDDDDDDDIYIYIYIYIYIWCFTSFDGPVRWSCRIHWLHICRGVRLSQRVSCYDTKKFDGEAPVMRSTPSLPLLLGSLWPGVVASERVK